MQPKEVKAETPTDGLAPTFTETAVSRAERQGQPASADGWTGEETKRRALPQGNSTQPEKGGKLRHRLQHGRTLTTSRELK